MGFPQIGAMTLTSPPPGSTVPPCGSAAAHDPTAVETRECLDAYVGGRISRRSLIRRLVAGGVTLGAAISYAHILAPERTEAAGCEPYDSGDNEYPGQTLRVTNRSTGSALGDGALSVLFDSDTPGVFSIGAWCGGVARTNGTLRKGGQLLTEVIELELEQPATQTLELPLLPSGIAILNTRAGDFAQIVGASYPVGQGKLSSMDGETFGFRPAGGEKIKVRAFSQRSFCGRPYLGLRISRARKLSR